MNNEINKIIGYLICGSKSDFSMVERAKPKSPTNVSDINCGIILFFFVLDIVYYERYSSLSVCCINCIAWGNQHLV
jgi:hypothetical protein